MRKDHDRLHQRMTEIYENLKQYNNREDELRKIEQAIEEKENILKQAQQRLEEIEERIKENGFSDYLETELKEESLVSPQFEEEDISKVSNLEAYNLVDNCKAMIIDKNFTEAKKVYMQLRETYTTLKMESSEKDLLYAAIRELYDDIKLAEMENAGL
jgi:exonuclease VII large subunit